MKIRFRKSAIFGTDAFTLPEVVVSTVVISIGAAGLMGCFGFAYRSMQFARENQRATQIMLERAEAIRLCSWDQVNTPGFIPTEPFTDYYDPFAQKGTVYTGNVTLAPFPYTTSYSTNMRQLTISLSWETKGVVQSRTNVTYISKDGVQNYVY